MKWAFIVPDQGRGGPGDDGGVASQVCTMKGMKSMKVSQRALLALHGLHALYGELSLPARA